MVDLWTVRATIAKNPQLAKLKNVRFLSAGKRIKDGKVTKENSIIFIVAKKGEVTGAGKIPKFIPGVDRKGNPCGPVPTDVVELKGDAEFLGLRSGYLVIASDRARGRVLIAQRDTDGDKYVLTNAHVLSDVDGDIHAGDVKAVDINTGVETPIGRAIYATPLSSQGVNEMDAGVVKVKDQIKLDNMKVLGESKPIESYDYFGTNDGKLYYVADGRSTVALVNPQKVLTPESLISDGKNILFNNFWRLDVKFGTIGPGHSGSLIYRRKSDRLIAVGIVFAGIKGKEVWAFSALSAKNAVEPHMD